MSDAPWLSIIGLGEDGLVGLGDASRAALDGAEVVMGARRHLDLIGETKGEQVVWPIPFADGLPILEGFRGRPVAALASGDPFWFGAGSVLAARLAPGEWRAFPGRSSFALAAAHLGWPLERTRLLGLHAAPLERLRPHLAPGARIIALLRDGAAVGAAAALISALGFGDSRLWVMERLGGPRERVRKVRAAEGAPEDVTHPVALAIEAAGPGPALPAAASLSDDLFDHDGQITKAPIRALTLSALAPRAGERLWDIGAGSGSISIAWALSGPGMSAYGVEVSPERAARARGNALKLGADGVEIVEGGAPDALADLPPPDAIFIGGGLSEALLRALWRRIAPGVRVVANAVTLESEAVLADWHRDQGGDLMRIDIARAAPLGTRRGWRAAYPIVQWSGRR